MKNKVDIKKFLANLFCIALGIALIITGIIGIRKVWKFEKVNLTVTSIKELHQENNVSFDALFVDTNNKNLLDISFKTENEKTFNSIVTTNRKIFVGDKINGYYDKINKIYYLDIGIDIMLFPLMIVLGVTIVLIIALNLLI